MKLFKRKVKHSEQISEPIVEAPLASPNLPPPTLNISVKRCYHERLPLFGEREAALTLAQARSASANWAALQCGSTAGYNTYSHRIGRKAAESPLCFVCDTFFSRLYLASPSLKALYCGSVLKGEQCACCHHSVH
jgi:hypothetical protein